MTNWTPRRLEVPLKNLGKGAWESDVYADGPEAARMPTDVVHSQSTLQSRSTLKIVLAPGGGWASHLRPAAK
jgi:hypothetical protein